VNPHSYHSSKGAFGAFTLIELLIVISIIGVLSTLGLSVFNKVQIKGQSAKSVSNMRQIYVGHLNYFNDYNRFPSANDWINNGPEAGSKTWHERLGPYVGLGENCEESLKTFKINQLPPSVFQVPGRRRLLPCNGGDAGGFRSGYVRSLKINQNESDLAAGNSFQSLIAFQKLASSYFLIDTGGDSAANDFNGWQIDDAARLKWPAFGGKTGSLNGTINVCFMDGHMESRNKKDVTTDWRDVFWDPAR